MNGKLKYRIIMRNNEKGKLTAIKPCHANAIKAVESNQSASAYFVQIFHININRSSTSASFFTLAKNLAIFPLRTIYINCF